MPNDPEVPIAPVGDPTAMMFRRTLLTCPLVAGIVVLSWQQKGIWPIIECWLLSASVAGSGVALLFTLRARSLATPTLVRSWMRPAVMAVFIFAAAIAVSTVWRAVRQ